MDKSLKATSHLEFANYTEHTNFENKDNIKEKIVNNILKRTLPTSTHNLKFLIDYILSKNERVFLVGGLVRDLLEDYNNNVKDVDLNYTISQDDLRSFIYTNFSESEKFVTDNYFKIGERDDESAVEGFHINPLVNSIACSKESTINSMVFEIIKKPDEEYDLYLYTVGDSLSDLKEKIYKKLDNCSSIDDWWDNTRNVVILWRNIKFALRGYNVDKSVIKALVKKAAESYDKIKKLNIPWKRFNHNIKDKYAGLKMIADADSSEDKTNYEKIITYLKQVGEINDAEFKVASMYKVNLHDARSRARELQGGRSKKRRRPTKRRRHTKRRRPTKKRRPTKRRR